MCHEPKAFEEPPVEGLGKAGDPILSAIWIKRDKAIRGDSKKRSGAAQRPHEKEAPSAAQRFNCFA
jgi:hypothetical protein